MAKNKFFLAGILIFGITLIGCKTTQHHLEISNVQSAREVYIRNAGAHNWGSNVAGHLKDIDKSKFSTRVDVRVIDANGIVYSKYNVPFGDAAFVETGKTRSINRGFLYSVTGVAGIVAIVLYLIL